MNITLQDILNHPGSPLDFATSRGLSLTDLLNWWNSEQTQSQLKDLEDLTQTLTRLRASLHSPAAMDHLRNLLDPSASPIERRRTATTILRHTAKSRAPSRSAFPKNQGVRTQIEHSLPTAAEPDPLCPVGAPDCCQGRRPAVPGKSPCESPPHRGGRSPTQFTHPTTDPFPSSTPAIFDLSPASLLASRAGRAAPG